ncbi:unnamed protein product [Aphanomyces euteiches]
MVNTQPNIRRPLRLSATEIRENHAKLTRIVNEYVAPPQPSPADGRLCQGRMSDGSKCQLPASKCYLRAQGVHVSTPGVMPRRFGKSIKPGLMLQPQVAPLPGAQSQVSRDFQSLPRPRYPCHMFGFQPWGNAL